MRTTPTTARFPVIGGVLLGAGLAGLFDGIVLHQLLQWHHLLSQAARPAVTIDDLRFHVLADGVFHVAAVLLAIAGLVVFWRSPHRLNVWFAGRLLAGSLLMGFGGFNVVEGLLNHFVLGLHHVNETVPPAQWLAWDLGFLALNAVLLLWGRWWVRDARRRTPFQ